MESKDLSVSEESYNMDSEVSTFTHQPSINQRLFAALFPVLLIAIGYIDPGKWAVVVEGGARFGFDLVTIMLAFNLSAAMCQYMSAQIAIVTGKNLVQVCMEEYDKVTCTILGILAELSLINLDLTMILGTAHGLNLIFGVDLFTCVFLTAAEAVLFPVFAAILENSKPKLICICMASCVLLFYIFGVLSSQTEFPLSLGGIAMKCGGECAFALMSLLGASIMPHNFYLHSSIVQQSQKPTIVSKVSLCHDQLFAILFIFSGIFLVNYVLMTSAANVFHGSGLVLLTFQDALSVMDQVFRSPVAPFALISIMFSSNQITASTWNLGKQVVLHDFLRLEIPGWLHHATIRVIAIVPALCCVYKSGAEGIYQLLIFTQVLVAIFLPASVIPLFRIASSRFIMGVYKVSQLVEFLSVMMLIGVFGLKISFIIEMIFGNSDWVNNSRWSAGINPTFPYVILLVTAAISLCLTLWLVATPLKSACLRPDGQPFKREMDASLHRSEERDNNDFVVTGCYVREPLQEQKHILALEKTLGSYADGSLFSPDINLPKTILDSDRVTPPLTTIEENCSDITFPDSSVHELDELETTVEEVQVSTATGLVLDVLQDASPMKSESNDLAEKNIGKESDLQNEKENQTNTWEPKEQMHTWEPKEQMNTWEPKDQMNTWDPKDQMNTWEPKDQMNTWEPKDQMNTWEPKESPKEIAGSNPSLTSDCLPSVRSLSGKGDETGSGAGSLSRLAGLGRAARRQLTIVLDEFWGQLFDFHGVATLEAIGKKLDVLLGIDSKHDTKLAPALLKVDNSPRDSSGYFPSVGGKGAEILMRSSLCDPPKQQIGQGCMEPSYGVQRGSRSLWSSNMQSSDLYVQNPGGNTLDAGERRYSSLRLPTSSDGFNLRLPTSSDGYDNQPATIHGYKIASYLNRISKEQSPDYLNSQIASQNSQSPSFGSMKMRDSLFLDRKPQNGLGLTKPPGFSNVPTPRGSSFLSKPPGFSNVIVSQNSSRVSVHDLYSTETVENVGSCPINAKKFYSLPDISGLAHHQRSVLMSERNAELDNPTGHVLFPGRSVNGRLLYSSLSSSSGAPLAVGDYSPSKGCRDAFSLQFSSTSDTGLLWSRKPFEQFGVADKTCSVEAEGVGTTRNSAIDETASTIDFEAKLLQSFRHCIMKLLKLEGSDWLFSQNDGVDEDLIDRVAAREKFLYEAETREINGVINGGEGQISSVLVTSVPNCGEGCIWKSDLIISFGVWCIHRILELSLMESRPELWGKYTYVLNRLQGIIDLAFSKPRTRMTPCFCLQVPATYQQRASPPISNGSVPRPAKQGRGKCTTAAMILDIIKDVEIAISCRKGRTGTAAGDVAFPKGKENLASVLKRYKRRLANKAVGSK